MSIERIAVIGGGTMGNGIAHVAAQHGKAVRLIDVSGEVLERALATISKNLDRQVKKELIDEAARDATLARIETASSVEEGAPGMDLVIEAVPEIAELKYSIFETLDRVADEGALLASNTSSISITEELDKTPVEVNDFPGFVSNRVLMPMINEAVFALMEGVAQPEAIDTVMKLGMNHPMGPLALADLIGLDTCLNILEVLHRELGDDRYRPCPLLRKYVAAGWLGRKAGRGFYGYA
jgi:3-hydroxybutyryl-CoA dehydrogenase